MLEPFGGTHFTTMLSKLKALDEAIYEEALKRLAEHKGPELAASFRKRVGRTKARAKIAPAEQMRSGLGKRKAITAKAKTKDIKEYKIAVLKDRAAVRRKILIPEAKRRRVTKEKEAEEVAQMLLPSADIASNDTGLPFPSSSKEAQLAEQWCKEGSWTICSKCSSVRPRPLTPMDLKRIAKPIESGCGVCKCKEYVATLYIYIYMAKQMMIKQVTHGE